MPPSIRPPVGRRCRTPAARSSPTSPTSPITRTKSTGGDQRVADPVPTRRDNAFAAGPIRAPDPSLRLSPVALGRPALDIGEDGLDVRQDLSGLGRKVAAELGEHDAAAAALEQQLTELILERLDLPAQRRL